MQVEGLVQQGQLVLWEVGGLRLCQPSWVRLGLALRQTILSLPRSDGMSLTGMCRGLTVIDNRLFLPPPLILRWGDGSCLVVFLDSVVVELHTNVEDPKGKDDV